MSYEIIDLDLDRDRIVAVVDASRTTAHLKLQPEQIRAPSTDTESPEPPDRLRNVVDCTTGAQDYALEGASDDASPLESLRYQGVRFDSRTNSFYVNPDGFDESRTGSLVSTPLVGLDQRFRLRAVDQAGNRSEIVELPLGQEEFIGC